MCLCLFNGGPEAFFYIFSTTLPSLAMMQWLVKTLVMSFMIDNRISLRRCYPGPETDKKELLLPKDVRTPLFTYSGPAISLRMFQGRHTKAFRMSI